MTTKTAKRATGKRWVCPDCGSGVLAPAKPRLDDVRRYCLDCSKKTGRLVKRTCPALDRERAAASEKRAAKAKATAAKAKADRLKRRSHSGVDLDAEAKRMWRAFVEGGRVSKTRALPTIDIRWRSEGYSTGRAWPTRIVMTLGRADSLPGVLTLLLHELAHSAAGFGHGHDVVWASIYADGARRRFGAEHFTGIRPHSGYAVDRYVNDGIVDYLAAQAEAVAS